MVMPRRPRVAAKPSLVGAKTVATKEGSSKTLTRPAASMAALRIEKSGLSLTSSQALLQPCIKKHNKEFISK